MNGPACICTKELDDHARQITVICWTADLVGDHAQPLLTPGELENGIRKAPTNRPEQPGGPKNTAARKNFKNALFGICFRTAVDIDGADCVLRIVGGALCAIKNVVGAHEQ